MLASGLYIHAQNMHTSTKHIRTPHDGKHRQRGTHPSRHSLAFLKEDAKG